MATRTELREDAMKLGLSILQSAKDPDHLLQHNKYLGTILKWDLQKKTFKKLLEHPQVKPLIEERYVGTWPSPVEMGAMPINSLGYCVQQRMKGLGIDELSAQNKSVEKIIKRGDEEEYFNSRIRITHDIHHLVLGFPVSIAGEAATSAYYAISMQEAGVIAPLATWMTRSFMEPTEHRMIWAGISFGIQVGLAGTFIEGCRWEEGWERPLADWREELGLLPLLEKSPFQDELHRWESMPS